MASFDFLSAVTNYLDDAGSGNVVSSINTDLGAGTIDACYVVRAPRDPDFPRKQNPKDTVVELHPGPAGQSAPAGIGWLETDVIVDMLIFKRLKGPSAGETQVEGAEKIARALKHRYNGTTNHSLTVPTGTTFSGALAEISALDGGEGDNTTTAGVRTVWSFVHLQEANT